MRSRPAAAANQIVLRCGVGLTNGATHFPRPLPLQPPPCNVGSEDHQLLRLPQANGCGQSTCAPLWWVPTGGGVNSSPALVNNILYISGSQDGKLLRRQRARLRRYKSARPCGSPRSAAWCFASSPAVSSMEWFTSRRLTRRNPRTAGIVCLQGRAAAGRLICGPLWSAAAGDFVSFLRLRWPTGSSI